MQYSMYKQVFDGFMLLVTYWSVSDKHICRKRSRRSNYQTNKDKKIFIGEGKDEDENPSIDDLSGTDMQEQSIDWEDCL